MYYRTHALLVAEARRDLFQAGLVVIERGSQSLEKEAPRSCGTIIYHKQDQGFQLETTSEFGGRIQSLTFITAPAKP